MKKTIAIILVLASSAFLFASCGGKKELVCDNCGKSVFVDRDSPMTDEWRIFCKDCEKDLGLESAVPVEDYTLKLF